MPDHEQDPVPTRLIVPQEMFWDMESRAQFDFRKQFADLTFDEAAKVVGAVVVETSRRVPWGAVRDDDDRVIVDVEDDGREAFTGFADQLSRLLAPRIDDNRELVIEVMGIKTLLDNLLHRLPKVERTFRFRNEPYQDA